MELIGKKAVIDIIVNYPHGDWNIETIDDMVNMVKALPSINDSETLNSSDVISRQSALEAAAMVIARDKSGSNIVVNAMIAWSEYIRQLPSAEPHWIPVTERLPETLEDVLVRYYDEVTIGWLNEDKTWTIEFEERVDMDIITAWMPMPKFYTRSIE